MKVGQLFRRQERYKKDGGYREKQRKYVKDCQKKDRKNIIIYQKKWINELSIFKNHKCFLCGNLLNYRAKGNYCRGCIYSNPILKGKNGRNY